MKKILYCLLLLVLAGVFGFSLYNIVMPMREYKKAENLYTQAAEEFTVPAPTPVPKAPEAAEPSEPEEPKEVCPIKVDFEALQKAYPNVEGWIYCADTPINYPVVRGKDNDFYLTHTYANWESSSGAIFVDCSNGPRFEDSNTIIYGHNMKNGSMFASLLKWREQEFYNEHPVMWLLTPEQNYKIVLFAGYTTPAESETYTIFSSSGQDLADYLVKCASKSYFAIPQTELPLDGHYVVLSTCSYSYSDARFVLHGLLQPCEQ